jgi:hypothetical protein
MDVLHKLLLTGEITTAVISGLIAISAIMGFTRELLHGPDPTWHPDTDIPVAMAKAANEGWVHRQLVAFDIAFNVIVLRGQQDETISTHSYRAMLEGKTWGKLMCKWLNGFQANHGPKATSGDYQRALTRVQMLKKALGL